MPHLPKVSYDLVMSFLSSHMVRENADKQMSDLIKRIGQDNNEAILDGVTAFIETYDEYEMCSDKLAEEVYNCWKNEENNGVEHSKYSPCEAFLSGAQFIYGLLSRAAEIEEMGNAEKLASYCNPQCEVCKRKESVVGPLSSNEKYQLVCDDCMEFGEDGEICPECGSEL